MVVYLKTAKGPSRNSAGAGIDVPSIVKGVIDDIRANSDAAVRSYSEKFDRWSPPSFRLSSADIDAILARVPQRVIDDIKTVQENVRTFALAQRKSISDFELEIRPGVHLGRKMFRLRLLERELFCQYHLLIFY